MRLIITHEQSDFDAIASLFGAYLADESAIPVLPRRLNRNVRSFVSLYGSELPFVEPRDVPSMSVESVTLVDTQSLVTLKGMNEKTRINVIDHHPIRHGLPDDWHINHIETGATTTFFVENFQKRDEYLSVIRATLLLLGIYEDTGSLTYTNTHARDARAAAYLLEQGADLHLAADYLNPPLSPDQRTVYEQLVSNAQTHAINGHRIVIACSDAGNLDEEISTLAHKLRDLFDTDAVFVLVATQEGIRLVARSTSDQVDVSVIAKYFKGGGHERAAAALIRSPSLSSQKMEVNGSTSQEGQKPSDKLKKINEDLLHILPRYIKPSITVSQIMSPHPQTLSPETQVQKAAQLMQRYGYEGYPVLQDGKVIGLLTRRAVDRAIGHHLNLTAASLMEAGEVTVTPDDSIQHLQTCMTESGWGQIPVVNPDKSEIVGIVTRTDLLKILAPQRISRSHRNLIPELEKALPPERLALLKIVAKEATEKNIPLYIVGGFVRDLLLGHPSLDFDLVVEGDAIELANTIAAKYKGKVTGHTRFGTSKWFLGGSTIQGQNLPPFLDFISARIEFYTQPTALPTVERGSIKLDLHRRDFTINTLALRLDGRHYGDLFDFWGGLVDLERGLIRVLHSLSFIDDPTRMLRAVRFEQRFDFNIETRTQQLMTEALPLLERLSSERIGHEIDLILDEPKAADVLGRSSDLDLLASIHPALSWDDRIQHVFASCSSHYPPNEWGTIPEIHRVSRLRAMRYIIWLGSYPIDDIRKICKRLRLGKSIQKALLEAATLYEELPSFVGEKTSVICSRLEDFHPFVIYAMWILADDPVRSILDNYLGNWRHVSPTVNGHDLKRLGLTPGPGFQAILRRLRDARLDGEVFSDEDEHRLLKTILESQ